MIKLSIGNKIIEVKPERIIRVKGEGNYAVFFLIDGRTVLSARHLGHWETKLPGFILVHKGNLVNPAFITDMDTESVTIDGTVFPISRRRRKIVSQLIIKTDVADAIPA
ncbi:LytTR family transcriptional regulator DNA-binding domain-containing protein [Tellurirhabdus bombi]|uniref:LytTR family transcriptional regulator DNA-binding domain-containing protein n=1 Tax=Tellurirhabdus bombi TaxID=2907205 RepID=UPI001F19F929|nr:LytTR family transcriptional regulator DNA-binding domain-containing protein [Tellurirhabdus bombi]